MNDKSDSNEEPKVIVKDQYKKIKVIDEELKKMQRSVLSQSLLASQAILKDSKFVKIENEIK